MNHDHDHDHDHSHDHGDHAMQADHTEVPKTPFKDFIPLIVIFSVIILFTVFMQLRASDADVMFAMRNFMGGFFIVFGGFKVLNWKGFAEAYSMYDIIAKRSRAYAYAYPVIELALGLAYLLAFQLLLTNIVTLVVMIVGSIGVANELRKKNQITCACLGVVFKIPMTKVTLIEDVLMATMAAVMILILV